MGGRGILHKYFFLTFFLSGRHAQTYFCTPSIIEIIFVSEFNEIHAYWDQFFYIPQPEPTHGYSKTHNSTSYNLGSIEEESSASEYYWTLGAEPPSASTPNLLENQSFRRAMCSYGRRPSKGSATTPFMAHIGSFEYTVVPCRTLLWQDILHGTPRRLTSYSGFRWAAVKKFFFFNFYSPNAEGGCPTPRTHVRWKAELFSSQSLLFCLHHKLREKGMLPNPRYNTLATGSHLATRNRRTLFDFFWQKYIKCLPDFPLVSMQGIEEGK